MAAARDEVSEVDVDGVPSLARTEDVEELRATKPNSLVRLLPGFDQYVIAVNRDLILAAHRATGEPHLRLDLPGRPGHTAGGGDRPGQLAGIVMSRNGSRAAGGKSGQPAV